MSIESARAAKASRARALAALASGRLGLAEAVRQPPRALRSTDLWYVLLACPRMGRETSRRVCERANVWPHLTMEELTPSQRQAIVDHLP